MSSHFFIVGRKGFGVLFIRTTPLRVASVSHETITAYEASRPGVDGYARVAAAAKAMLVRQDGQPEAELDQVQIQGIEALVSGGAVVSEADFAFIGEVVDAGWDFNRMVLTPIEAALKAVGPAGSITGELFDAILADDPNAAP
ncbi:hypothetical protein [Agrobacterium pusense]|uniref:hypothetical protein n=1 Tax=Agrobacterium pusense TaxID=648995 RepID=UPI0008924C30|nr:hypothetical protein [Agrobacterium pusense]OOO24084.1 hypothetical protein BTE56_01310 [Agrobacterium pusense]WKD44859.1 hypothetical protein M8C82_04450 [Agrobacterium pusense]SDE78998.1 hypothetical protein SAMN05421750_103313 [Agrobacterium pusense]